EGGRHPLVAFKVNLHGSSSDERILHGPTTLRPGWPLGVCMAPVPLTMGAPDADSQGATYSSWVIIAPEGPFIGSFLFNLFDFVALASAFDLDRPPQRALRCLVLCAYD